MDKALEDVLMMAVFALLGVVGSWLVYKGRGEGE